MDASSLDPFGRASKIETTVLQALQQNGKAAAVAVAMQVNDSTISRLKNEHLQPFSRLLAHLGLKVVPADRVCVDREMYRAMTRIASRAMANEEVAQRLIWDDEE